MIKIAVNTRLLRKNQMDGIGWFTYNTFKNIVRNNPAIEFHFLFDSGVDKEFLFSENVIGHNLFPPAKHALLNIAWFEWSVKKKLNKIKPDLFISPDGILSLGWKGPQYGVIHDINFYHMPEVLKYSNNIYYNYFFPKYATRAKRIGTVSMYSKNDIASSFHINPDTIDVVYSGVNNFYTPVQTDTIRLTKEKYTKGKPYFLFIGSISPRKNIDNLMKAFDLFKKTTGSDIKLLIVGKFMYKTEDLFQLQKTMQHKEDIIFAGRIPDEDINNVLASALCLTFIPIFEGFGLPPVEAMQCNVPVIASNVTSVPEIVGDAGILVNPLNLEEIKNAMCQVAQDINLRTSLINKGQIRKQLFTWQNTANLLWSSIQKAM